MAGQRYFFCGIGGSGMLPLARLLAARGADVAGSDRAFDQGRFPELERRIRAAGISIFPQDGSGLQGTGQVLVTSAAVEAGIPDVVAARTVGAEMMTRAALLADLTNRAPISCGVAGTSGKSTTTAMLAHVLIETGRDPSVVNGAPWINHLDADGQPTGWRAGEKGPFVCEVDESDGSIALYGPTVGVILNVSEDHKPMEELRTLFSGFARRSAHVVLGIDSPPVAEIAATLGKERTRTFSLKQEADFRAETIVSREEGLRASLAGPGGARHQLEIPLIGTFNIGNAIAAIAAADLLGVPPEEAVEALRTFQGSVRRLQTIGRASGVTVIDDFAHNPDKIAASIGALSNHFGRITVLYQPHGYGPLAQFRSLYEDAFSRALRRGDRLFISKPAYFGGTVTFTDDAEKLVGTVSDRGLDASYLDDREAFLGALGDVRPGEAVVVMGARDDSLTALAYRILEAVGKK